METELNQTDAGWPEQARAALATGGAAVARTSRQLAALAPEAARAAGLRPTRVYIARSVTVEPLLPFLRLAAAGAGLWLEIEVGGYGAYIDDLLNPEGSLARWSPELVLMLLDLEDVGGDLPAACARGDAAEIAAAVERIGGDLENLLVGLRRHSAARVVAQGFVAPAEPTLGEVADANAAAGGEAGAVASLNARLAAACRRIGDAVFFDQDRVAARGGRARWRDERMFRFSRTAVAAEHFPAYARALARSIRALFLPPRKVLCTDLDNTLWGGVLGEEGAAGIATGATFPGNCYREYQRYLRRLAARGVLLAIVSKNDERDAREAFQKRAADMGVSWDDFAAVKIGWGDKAAALREIAAELSLGLDSLVFVDDEPVECEAARRQAPGVLVIQAPRDEPWRLVEVMAEAAAFDAATITAEDRARGEEYKAQARRAQLESAAGSREAFLASLEIACELLPAAEAPLARAAQLTQKTNQFNLTTRRYGGNEIERFAAAPGGYAAALRYRDRFGDAGVIGLALAETRDGRCRIDTFLLSCRVIGRGVESFLLWDLATRARAAGARALLGEYIPTARNQPCQDFYDRHGFRRLEQASEAGGVLYEMDLTAGAPERPAWIAASWREAAARA